MVGRVLGLGAEPCNRLYLGAGLEYSGIRPSGRQG